MVRAMLSDSGLEKKFWAEALSTAGYLRNRSVTTAVNGMTPHEAFTGEKPSVQHLKVFGCDAYIHVPKDERKKLDAKAKKCTLLGYGTETKGYRLYNHESCRVFYSRDVIFNELKEAKQSEEVVENEMTESGKHTVELEIKNEEEMIEETVQNQANSTEESLRRSERLRRPTDFYGVRVNIADGEPREPRTVTEARASPQHKEWENAMNSEMKSLKQNDVWDLVELPSGKSTVGSKWVFKTKSDA